MRTALAPSVFVTANLTGGTHPLGTLGNLTGGLDGGAAVGQLEAQARAAWATIAREHRWTLWVRLSWAVPVSEVTAANQLAHWVHRLQRQAPGAVVLVGQHADSGRRHAHALVYLPQRWTAGRYPPGLRVVGWTWEAWLGWTRGLVWVDRYRPFRIRGGGDPRRHGAAMYLAKDVGTVELFGAPVPYVPRRTRR